MPSLSSVIMLVRGIGLGCLAQIAANSRSKIRLDAAYLDHTVSEPQGPGKYNGYAQNNNELSVHFANAVLHFAFLAPDLLRFSWLHPDFQSNPSPRYAFAGDAWPPIPFQCEELAGCLRLSTSDLSVTLAHDGAAQIFDPQGHLLRAELPPSFQITAANALHPAQIQWTSRAVLDPGEYLAGLGEHSGSLGLRGRAFSLWNTDPGGAHGPTSDPLYMPLPVYLSLQRSGSCLVFFDNSARAVFEFDTPSSPGQAKAAFETGELTWYLCVGSPSQAIARFSQLTGLPPLPPRWSLGYHQSRWGYKTAADIRQVAAGFAEHNLPLDAIHLDIDYMDGFRVFTVDRKAFPDLPELAAELHSQGTRLVAIIDPGVKRDPEYPVYQQGSTLGYFSNLPDDKPLTGIVWPGRCAFPDFTNPATRQWWGDQYQFLLEAGVVGIWHDMNEPAAFAASGASTLPLAARHDLDGHPGDHLQAHNLYGMQMNRAAWEGLRRLQPERRPWIVSRSGWIGNQRYAWNWTADVATAWENLSQTIATLLGMGLSALPFTGSDIGGFTGDPSPELYLRWFQMATFNAFMRTHSVVGASARHPWTFGEPYTTHLSAALLLRQRLLPYIYTQAWIASQSGAPLVRPLFWLEPQNPELWMVDDAFLFGECFLVAPVCTAGAINRNVPLPAGSWFDFWNDELLIGPGLARTTGHARQDTAVGA